MKKTKLYAGYRYPSQAISHAVWLHHRFTLSFRDVEALLAASGISVNYGTVRNWCLKFGNQYCNQIRKKRRFKSQGQAQRFLACHGVINNLFRLGRHLLRATNYRILRDRALSEWERASCLQNMA